MIRNLPLSAVSLFVLASCSSMRSPVAPGAVPKDHGLIGAGEGPAWHDGSLYFTDGKHINRMDPQGRTHVFRRNASNGLLFDREGRLIACETVLRRVTRTEKDGSITVLADRFRGKRFNSPNDLCMDSKGRIYFTDPRYGSRDGMEMIEYDVIGWFNGFPVGDFMSNPQLKTDFSRFTATQRHLLSKRTPKRASLDDLISNQIMSHWYRPLLEGVYRIGSPGKVTRILCKGAERPNGILISPDDRFLYIADNNNNNRGGSRKLLRYELDENGDVKPGSSKVIFDWKDGRGPDGIKMDAAGRIYVAAGTNQETEWETNRFKAGCYILSPGGRLLDFIPTAPDECCNCAFGGPDGRTLFITSGSHLWSVPLRF